MFAFHRIPCERIERIHVAGTEPLAYLESAKLYLILSEKGQIRVTGNTNKIDIHQDNLFITGFVGNENCIDSGGNIWRLVVDGNVVKIQSPPQSVTNKIPSFIYFKYESCLTLNVSLETEFTADLVSDHDTFTNRIKNPSSGPSFYRPGQFFIGSQDDLVLHGKDGCQWTYKLRHKLILGLGNLVAMEPHRHTNRSYLPILTTDETSSISGWGVTIITLETREDAPTPRVISEDHYPGALSVDPESLDEVTDWIECKQLPQPDLALKVATSENLVIIGCPVSAYLLVAKVTNSWQIIEPELDLKENSDWEDCRLAGMKSIQDNRFIVALNYGELFELDCNEALKTIDLEKQEAFEQPRENFSSITMESKQPSANEFCSEVRDDFQVIEESGEKTLEQIPRLLPHRDLKRLWSVSMDTMREIDSLINAATECRLFARRMSRVQHLTIPNNERKEVVRLKTSLKQSIEDQLGVRAGLVNLQAALKTNIVTKINRLGLEQDTLQTRLKDAGRKQPDYLEEIASLSKVMTDVYNDSGVLLRASALFKRLDVIKVQARLAAMPEPSRTNHCVIRQPPRGVIRMPSYDTQETNIPRTLATRHLDETRKLSRMWMTDKNAMETVNSNLETILQAGENAKKLYIKDDTYPSPNHEGSTLNTSSEGGFLLCQQMEMARKYVFTKRMQRLNSIIAT